MALLNVLRHLAPRQSLHCGPDQSRDARLRRTVDWLNRNRLEASTQLCTNLKTRAHELKELAGARTKW